MAGWQNTISISTFDHPEGWTRDPKSGSEGVSNFVKVDQLFLTGLYEREFRGRLVWRSTGTFVCEIHPAIRSVIR